MAWNYPLYSNFLLTYLFSRKFLYNFISFPGWLNELGSWITSYKPITNTAWVRVRLSKLQKGCTRLTTASDKVYNTSYLPMVGGFLWVLRFPPSIKLTATIKTITPPQAFYIIYVGESNVIVAFYAFVI